MVWTYECSQYSPLTEIMFSGIVLLWTIIVRTLIWSISRISALIRMVCRNEHVWLCLTDYFAVPVIAVFTKYDQFLRNVEIDLEDFLNEALDSDILEVAQKLFREHYLCPLGDGVRFVRLASMCTIKLPGYMLMFFCRTAYEKYVLWRLDWSDSYSIKWWCCFNDAFSCAEEQPGVKC